MSTARFDLRAGSKTIYLHYRNGRGNPNFRWSTKIEVQREKNWDKKNQKIRENKVELGAYSKNRELRKIKNFFLECYPQNKTTEELKKLLNNEFRANNIPQPESQPKKMELYQYFKHVIDHDISKATKSSYQNAYNHLQRFNSDLTFAEIDLNFYDDFTYFMSSVETDANGNPLPNGYSHNTTASCIKVLKTIMNNSYKRSLHSNRKHTLKEFNVEFEEREQPFITENDIDKIINLKLNDPELYEIRKYLIIGCYAGLRISDILRLDEEFFNGEYIEFRPKKGHKNTKWTKTLTIPINSKIKRIISDGLPERTFSRESFNRLIRKLCKLAKIENHEIITSHAMRRSFCTNAYESGMELSDISHLMGHSSTKVTSNYLKISDSQRAKILQERNSFLK